MTSSIAPPKALLAFTECDFVQIARNNYDSGNAIVNVIDTQKRVGKAKRKINMDLLRSFVQGIENNLWEALARDYPKFRFRRQNQTIVISYNTTGQSVSIGEGEVSKIKSWGVNDYYEALDTVNRLQNSLYNSEMNFNRRWKDDWKRLGNQLVAIDRRNCKGFVEPIPGRPDIIVCPPTVPMPPSPPGPDLPVYPCPPIPAQGSWSTIDTRNWSITGWENSSIMPMAGNFRANRPNIVKVAGRELVYYAPNGINTTKLVWLFHGAGGSSRNWFTNYETIKYIKKLTDAGFAVAAFESFNRVSKKWAITTVPESSRDIIDLKSCQEFLAKAGIIKRICTSTSSVNPQTGQVTTTQTCTYTTPQYGVGMSQGGGMVSYAAKSLSLAKIIIHNASGISQIIRNENYNADTLWMLSANDSLVNGTEASDNYTYLQTYKPTLTIGTYIQVASKITAGIFDDISNVSTPIATAIVSGLVAAGFVNNDGSITTKYTSASKSQKEAYLQDTIPTIIATAFGGDSANYRTYVKDIVDQIKISFSDHEFSGWQRQEDGTLIDRDLAFLQA